MIDAAIAHLWNGEAAEPGERVRVIATWDARGLRLSVDAPFHGDPPPAVPPGRCPGLWEHEVVELFLVDAGGSYLEIELGPHGHYLALWLEAPRRISRSDLALDYRATRAGGRWSGWAQLAGELLPRTVVRWNAFAIHGIGAGRRHLAAHALPGALPDFHRIDAFPSLDR
jgi:hypothetical protein